MGIRYYAYPLAPKFTELARIDAAPFLSDDPFADVWFTASADRPEMLYLDKAWRWLQGLTWPADEGPVRAAYRLFEGHVTPIDAGSWRPWIRALDPADTADAARDLATLGDADVRMLIAGSRLPVEEQDGEISYVAGFLRQAQDFTRDLRERGWGLVYAIG